MWLCLDRLPLFLSLVHAASGLCSSSMSYHEPPKVVSTPVDLTQHNEAARLKQFPSLPSLHACVELVRAQPWSVQVETTRCCVLSDWASAWVFVARRFEQPVAVKAFWTSQHPASASSAPAGVLAPLNARHFRAQELPSTFAPSLAWFKSKRLGTGRYNART